MVHNVRRFFHVIINRQRSCGAAAAFVVAQINDCRVKLFICCNLSAPRWMKEHLCCSFGLMRHTWAGVHRCFSGLTFPNSGPRLKMSDHVLLCGQKLYLSPFFLTHVHSRCESNDAVWISAYRITASYKYLTCRKVALVPFSSCNTNLNL